MPQRTTDDNRRSLRVRIAGSRRSRLVIGLVEVNKENWSFGNGEV
ncbi:hypothetical protein [Glaciibacter superstes]|nr:hypothetical protein [Glaciibacter superstes]